MSGTALPSTPAFDPELRGLLTCVHCGLCLPACPTYQVLGEENDSPRGRLYLIRARVEGRENDQGARRTHLGHCLGCRACEPVCPAGVPYGALLEREREALLESRPVRAWLARLPLAALTGRRVGDFVYAGLRLLRGLGAARWIGGWAPGRVGLAARLLDVTRPEPRAAAPPGRGWRRTPGVAATSTDSVSSSDIPRSTLPGSAPAGRYALLEGCVMRGLFGHVHEATRSALSASGYREVRVTRQSCCGALHAHAGYMERAREMARHNIAAFERGRSDYVVTDAAGCGAALRDYPGWLARDPDWMPAAEGFAARVRDVTELLAGASRSRPAVPDGAPPSPSDPPSPKIAYDAPCHLLHAQGVEAAPLASVRAMAGIDMEPLASATDCCGGAGLYNLFHTSLSTRILDRKLKEIRAGGYEMVATGNPGCIMQIGAGLRAAGSSVRVVHPVELLADRA